MPLSRPYQNTAIRAINEDLAVGINALLLVLCTGSGKTVLAANLPTEVLKMKRGEQLMFLVHRDELVFQAKEKFERYNPELNVSIEKAEYYADPNADIIIASVQTLGKEPDDGSTYGKRLKKFNPARLRCLVIDESHHSPGENYLRIIRYFRVMKGDAARDPSKLLLGITATPNRSDNIGLELVFDKITYDYGIEQACNDGIMIDGELYPYLARPHGHRVSTNVDISKVKSTKDDFNIAQLGNAINTPERNNLVVDKYIELGQNFPFMVFTADIQHSHDMSAAFIRRGLICYPVSGNTPKDERRKFIRLYKEGAALGLASCDALTEGSDLPMATVGLMAKPDKSPLKYQQKAGRIFRPYPSPEDYIEMRAAGIVPDRIKKTAIIIDFCDTSARHSLVTIPTLYGLRADFDLRGESAADVAAKVSAIQKKLPGIDIKQYSSLEAIESAVLHVDLFRPPTVPDLVRKHSKFGWLEVGEGCYQIGIASTGSLLQVKVNTLGQYEVAASKNGTRVVLDTASSPSAAFAIADKMVPPTDTVLLKTTAAWHKEGPSAKQAQKLYYMDRELKVRYKSAGEFFAFAEKQHAAGNQNYSKGGLSRMIDSKTHAQGAAK